MSNIMYVNAKESYPECKRSNGDEVEKLVQFLQI
jgi:hypothetical protein